MYTSSFWDTELGNHLAHVLIRSLPEFAEKRKQTVTRVMQVELEQFLNQSLKEGKKIDQVIPIQDTSHYLVVLSEPAD